ncbi:MAG: hypothetical protein EXR83_01445 [Gammaproteobacteria bacterium]|nr:hypothetical protein [Gammaproteobacteria bacterium]
MITAFDDYLIHQTPQALAHVGTTDSNAYDRYFLEGFVADGSLIFGGAFGRYPNRDLTDAAFSVSFEGTQYSLFASGRAPLERTDSSAGPIAVEIIHPMRSLRLRVEDPQRGFNADLRFDAITGAIDEGRQTLTDGLRTSVDLTRYSQLGTWSGHIEVKGHRIELTNQRVLGVRDHSWGVRPLGGGGSTRWAPQIHWYWGPIFFENECLHWHLNDSAEGNVIDRFAALVPRVENAGSSPLYLRDTGGEYLVPTSFTPRYRHGTRRLEHLEVVLHDQRGPRMKLAFIPDPHLLFSLMGLGYTNKAWEHGAWRGEGMVDENAWPSHEQSPLFPRNWHMHHVCKVIRDDGVHGTALLEQCFFGPHQPSGLTGVTAGWPSVET